MLQLERSVEDKKVNDGRRQKMTLKIGEDDPENEEFGKMREKRKRRKKKEDWLG
jgi:hypothetical protein